MTLQSKPIDYKRWSLLPDDTEQEQPKSQSHPIGTDSKYDVCLKKTGASRIYRSESLSLMRIDDIVVSKSSTITEFKVTVKITGDNSIVEVEILNANLDNNIEEINAFNSLLYKISSVKDRIEIQLDKNGSIVDILNKEELKTRWSSIKQELAIDEKFSGFKPEEQQLILNAGDKEYSDGFDLANFLNAGYTLYAMLFNGYWKSYIPKQTSSLSQKNKNSTLFKDQSIPLDFEVKMKRSHNESGICELEIQGIETDNLDLESLKQMYLEIYPFAKQSFDEYSYDYEANYDVELETGLLTKMNATVFEKAGSIEMFMDCNIKMLNNEKGNSTK